MRDRAAVVSVRGRLRQRGRLSTSRAALRGSSRPFSAHFVSTSASQSFLRFKRLQEDLHEGTSVEAGQPIQPTTGHIEGKQRRLDCQSLALLGFRYSADLFRRTLGTRIGPAGCRGYSIALFEFELPKRRNSVRGSNPNSS